MKEYKQNSVILNSSNIVAGSNNSIFKYSFDSSIKFENAQIALNTINIFFSWFNISASLNNNRFSYKWFDSSGVLNQSHDVVITDGYYTVNNLNEFVQSVLVSRGHYVKQTSSGNYIYHIELMSNPVYYTIELNTYAMMPDTVGYVRGATTWAFPAVYTTVQVILNTTNTFSSIIGFENGVYPNVSDVNNHVFSSTKTPIMDPTSSVIVLCSFATQGGFSNPDNIIYSFTTGASSFGSMIEKSPVVENYVNIRDGLYSNFTIELVNQKYQRINIKDSETLIMVNFRMFEPDSK